MIRASIARRTSDGTSGAAALELIAGSKGCFLRELSVYLAAATLSTYGLGRPAATGITPTAPVPLLPEPSVTAGAVQSKTAIAWSTGPTVPAQFYRRISFPATIASYVIWTFPNGLWIPATFSVVLWNLAANGVVDVNAIIDEQQA